MIEDMESLIELMSSEEVLTTCHRLLGALYELSPEKVEELVKELVNEG